MKIYISADMEGVTGVTDWWETQRDKADYEPLREQMTREVHAACLGAIEAGAKEIWVKDAHDSGRNLNGKDLPKCVRLIKGWSGHPLSMVQELDNKFDAVILIGYHSCSGSNRNPLSHTMHAYDINYIKINDQISSEYLIHSYAAAAMKVPVVFVSGDKGLCDEVILINKNIFTVPVKDGIGNSTVNIHPDKAVDLIKNGVEKVLKGDIGLCRLELPGSFKVEISFVNHSRAYRASFYPGMKHISPQKVMYQAGDFFDVLRMMLFVI